MKPDRHILYEAAVQGVEYDLDFFERVWRTLRGGRFTRLREDFCGTAAIACGWVARRSANRAWAVDLDEEVLDWARAHRVPRLKGAASRLALVHRDVRRVTAPAVDLAVAFNFSYWVFHRRPDLVAYFRAVRRSLTRRGLFVVNAFGGTEAMQKIIERRRIAASTSVDGARVPSFTYVWDQARFNPVDHRLLCHIHFELRGGVKMRRAFTYDWRLWTLPEIEEAMLDAGFRAVEFWVEGWDAKRNRSDDVYHRRRRFENQESWLACVVGVV
jgi:predicted RNA methylase